MQEWYLGWEKVKRGVLIERESIFSHAHTQLQVSQWYDVVIFTASMEVRTYSTAVNFVGENVCK